MTVSVCHASTATQVSGDGGGGGDGGAPQEGGGGGDGVVQGEDGDGVQGEDGGGVQGEGGGGGDGHGVLSRGQHQLVLLHVEPDGVFAQHGPVCVCMLERIIIISYLVFYK